MDHGWYRWDQTACRLTLNLYVQPGAKHTEAAGMHADALKIRLAAAPVEGKANAALLEFLAHAFDVPLRQVGLKQGEHSRRKVVQIERPRRGPEALLQAR